MCAKGIRAFPLSLVALHHRSIHLFGGCCLRRLTRRFMDIHHTDLRLALGQVMATISIGLFVSASHPTVTSDARETGDRPAHWPGLLCRSHSLVGSKAGAVATGTGNCCLPEAFAIVRCLSPFLNSVSNFRLVVRSMRISRTTHSCSLHAKGYATYQAGSAFSRSCLGRYTR